MILIPLLRMKKATTFFGGDAARASEDPQPLPVSCCGDEDRPAARRGVGLASPFHRATASGSCKSGAEPLGAASVGWDKGGGELPRRRWRARGPHTRPPPAPVAVDSAGAPRWPDKRFVRPCLAPWWVGSAPHTSFTARALPSGQAPGSSSVARCSPCEDTSREPDVSARRSLSTANWPWSAWAGIEPQLPVGAAA